MAIFLVSDPTSGPLPADRRRSGRAEWMLGRGLGSYSLLIVLVSMFMAGQRITTIGEQASE